MEQAKIKPSEATVEILEALWTLEEKGSATVETVSSEVTRGDSRELLELLERESLITIDPKGQVSLLPEGRRLARQVIRRHRLAERLQCDVLGSSVEDSENAACEFEHLLAEEITSSICTLLGHPRFCPHGRPIPEGECCLQAREELRPIVVSSNLLNVGESGRVAYLAAREHSRLLRLTNLGIAPGVQLRLLQKWPSFVLQCEETEIALEEGVAKDIYVWRTPRG